MNGRKLIIWAVVVGVVATVATVLIVRSNRWRPRIISIEGAIIRRDQDPNRRLPVANVTVTATDGLMIVNTRSDASGYFDLKFRENVWPGQTVTVSFRSPDYESYDFTVHPGIRSNTQKLNVIELSPVRPATKTDSNKKPTAVTNIRIRYTVNSEGAVNIGSEVKPFQVVNKGNIPCNMQTPCSPDGKWKAELGSVTLDAGPDHEFRDVRASCIAGPCPFTRIDSSGFIQGGRVITAKALNWSDTATFLLEAEVFRTSINSNVRESYPVIFGQTLNFTLPPTEEGVSIEAELDGTPMVFPLGPDLYLSWATCNARTNRESEKSMVYRCELKPGYRF